MFELTVKELFTGGIAERREEESFSKCFNRCICQNRYTVAVCDTLGFWGLGSTIANLLISGGLKVGEKVILKISDKTLTVIEGRGFLYIKGLQKTFVLRRIKSGFALATRVTTVPTVFTTVYSGTRHLYCYIVCGWGL